jgi:hypothetical protein
MTVRIDDRGTIMIEGNALVGDAEPLLQLLHATPSAVVDWTRCEFMHTAVVQVLLFVRPTKAGACGDTWIENSIRF